MIRTNFDTLNYILLCRLKRFAFLVDVIENRQYKSSNFGINEVIHGCTKE